MAEEEAMEEYSSSLSDLTFNSKPLINMLTMLAEDNVQFAPKIVQVIEAHLQKVDEKTRQAMFKLRQTWNEIFPNSKMFSLDQKVALIDPAWPCTAAAPEPDTPTSIHVNPKFLVKEEVEERASKEQEKQQQEQEALMRQQLLAKQQELLKLQQQRLELELAEAKTRLEQQARDLEAKETEAPEERVPPLAVTNSHLRTQAISTMPTSHPATTVVLPSAPAVIHPPPVVRDPRVGRGKPDPRMASKTVPDQRGRGPAVATSAAATSSASINTGHPSRLPPIPKLKANEIVPTDHIKVSKASPTKEPKSGSSKSKISKHLKSEEKTKRSSDSKKGHKEVKQDKARREKEGKNHGERDHNGQRVKSSDGKREIPKEMKNHWEKEKDHKVRRSRSPDNKREMPRRSTRLARAARRRMSRSMSPVDRRSRSRSPRSFSRSKSPRDILGNRRMSDENKHRRNSRESSKELEDAAKLKRSEKVAHRSHWEGTSGKSRPPSRGKKRDSQEREGMKESARNSNEKSPPPKKPKQDDENKKLPDDLADLFGSVDQDYRQLDYKETGGPVVSTPKGDSFPSSESPTSAGWARFKASHPSEFPFAQHHDRPRLDLTSPRAYGSMHNPPFQPNRTPGPFHMSPAFSPGQKDLVIPDALKMDQASEILRQADSQLQLGNITHQAHQELLRQLSSLYKLQKIKQQFLGDQQLGGDLDEDSQIGTLELPMIKPGTKYGMAPSRSNFEEMLALPTPDQSPKFSDEDNEETEQYQDPFASPTLKGQNRRECPIVGARPDGGPSMMHPNAMDVPRRDARSRNEALETARRNSHEHDVPLRPAGCDPSPPKSRPTSKEDPYFMERPLHPEGSSPRGGLSPREGRSPKETSPFNEMRHRHDGRHAGDSPTSQEGPFDRDRKSRGSPPPWNNRRDQHREGLPPRGRAPLSDRDGIPHRDGPPARGGSPHMDVSLYRDGPPHRDGALYRDGPPRWGGTQRDDVPHRDGPRDGPPHRGGPPHGDAVPHRDGPHYRDGPHRDNLRDGPSFRDDRSFRGNLPRGDGPMHMDGPNDHVTHRDQHPLKDGLPHRGDFPSGDKLPNRDGTHHTNHPMNRDGPPGREFPFTDNHLLHQQGPRETPLGIEGRPNRDGPPFRDGPPNSRGFRDGPHEDMPPHRHDTRRFRDGPPDERAPHFRDMPPHHKSGPPGHDGPPGQDGPPRNEPPFRGGMPDRPMGGGVMPHGLHGDMGPRSGPHPPGVKPLMADLVPPPKPHLPIPEKPRTHCLPYDIEKDYVPQHDARWYCPGGEDGGITGHEIVLDNYSFGLPFDGSERPVKFRNHVLMLRANPKNKKITIDDRCVYRVGDPIRDVTMSEMTFKIFYHGPVKRMWVDGFQFDVRMDAPPEMVTFAGDTHGLRVNSITGDVLIDGMAVSKFGSQQHTISLGQKKHEIQYIPPPRQILIDNKLCELNLRGRFPFVVIDGVPRGIRFDGDYREILIDSKSWTVPVDKPIKARIGLSSRPHIIAFGGPGHEVIIDGKWYEVKFNGPPKLITIGSKTYSVSLEGNPPGVKILGDLIMDPLKIEDLSAGFNIDPSLGVLSSVKVLPDGKFVEIGPGGNQGPPPVPQNSISRGPPQIFGPGGQHGPLKDGPRGPPVPQPPMPLRGLGIDQGPRPMMMGPARPGLDAPNMAPGSPRRRDGPDGRPGLMRPDIPPGMDKNIPQTMHNHPRFPGPHGPPDDPRMMGPGGPMPPFTGPGPMMQMGPPVVSQGGPNMGPPGSHMRPVGSQMGPGVMGMLGLGPMVGSGHPPGPLGLGGMQMGPGQHGFGTVNVPMPTVPAPEIASQIDVNDLFSKLVSSGIIGKKESKDEKPAEPIAAPLPESKPEPEKPKNILAEIVKGPVAAVVKTEGAPEKALTPEPETSVEDLEDIPDLTDFNLAKLKVCRKAAFQRLFMGIQCSSCGMRFITDDMDKYREHLDWHFRQNKKEKEEMKVARFRKWYYALADWVQYEEFVDMEDKAQSVVFEKMLTSSTPTIPGAGALPTAGYTSQASEEIERCPAAQGLKGEDVCEICQETFRQVWDEDEEEWQFRDAIRVNSKNYHPVCYEDAKEQSFIETPTPEINAVDMITNPLAYIESLTLTHRETAEVTTEPVTVTPDVVAGEKEDNSTAETTLQATETVATAEQTVVSVQVKQEQMEPSDDDQVKQEASSPAVSSEVEQEIATKVPESTTVAVKQEPEEPPSEIQVKLEPDVPAEVVKDEPESEPSQMEVESEMECAKPEVAPGSETPVRDEPDEPLKVIPMEMEGSVQSDDVEDS